MIYIKTNSFLQRFHHSIDAQRASLSQRAHSTVAKVGLVGLVGLIGLAATVSVGLLGSSAAIAQDRPQNLPAIKLGAGMHVISAEVAQSPEQRAIGLMNRPSMGANEGMLFVFEEANPQCFWMKNTLLPLSIAFIADDGSVVNIAEMKPQSLDSHCSTKPVRYALEMNQGWFAKRGIKAGSKLTGRPWGQ